MKNNNFKKVVLAYSGGLDTSVIVSWLKEEYNCEVVCVIVNVGQKEDFVALENKAMKVGASKVYVLDVVDEFVDNYVFETLKAGAKYEDKYFLGTAFARPIIAKKLVEIADIENCDAIVHGCTGKGNDQVRFELGVRAFNADIPIIAPWRIWNIKSRTDAILYAEKRGIELPISTENNYSKDENIWHLSHEGMELEDVKNEPNYENILEKIIHPENASETSEFITIEFDKGVPIKVNDVLMKGSDILRTLNEIGKNHGIGIDDIVENRIVGMKSRGVYENSAAHILYKAHSLLESITLDSHTLKYKQLISLKFADLVYSGLWYSTLRESLSCFVEKTQEFVSGKVKLKLYKGNIFNCGIDSPFSLYDEGLSTFEADDVYNQFDSQGFVNLYSLETKVKSKMKERI